MDLGLILEVDFGNGFGMDWQWICKRLGMDLGWIVDGFAMGLRCI